MAFDTLMAKEVSDLTPGSRFYVGSTSPLYTVKTVDATSPDTVTITVTDPDVPFLAFPVGKYLTVVV